MSDEIRKDQVNGQGGSPSEASGAGNGTDPGKGELPHREEVLPRDHDLYTPQGGGSGTGAGPIREVEAAEKASEVVPVTTLPTVTPEEATAEALGLAADSPSGGPAAALERPEVSSFRLLMTLGVAGAIAGALLVFVFLWSDPIIQAERARILQEAVTEVLKGPDSFESVFVLDGELTTQVPEGVDTLALDKVFLGYDESGEPVGFALAAEGFGFQDIISVIFGYDPGAGELLGMKVLGHKETPGLGDKIVKDSVFVAEFDGVAQPIVGVKPSRASGGADEVVTITGVTISSVAVIRIINERIAEMGDLLVAYQPGGTVTAGGPAGREEDGQ
jgi:electron transport complex protein RnfG